MLNILAILSVFFKKLEFACNVESAFERPSGIFVQVNAVTVRPYIKGVNKVEYSGVDMGW